MPIYKTNEKNNDGLTKYRVRHNYTDAEGKAHSLTRIAYGLQAAKELERELSKAVLDPLPARFTLNDLYDEFIESHEAELRATTLRGYDTYYNNYIRPFIGDVIVGRINGKVLNDWKNSVNKLDIKLTTKRTAYAKLKTLFNFAIRLEYLDKNPLDKLPNFKDTNFVK